MLSSKVHACKVPLLLFWEREDAGAADTVLILTHPSWEVLRQAHSGWDGSHAIDDDCGGRTQQQGGHDDNGGQDDEDNDPDVTRMCLGSTTSMGIWLVASMLLHSAQTGKEQITVLYSFSPASPSWIETCPRSQKVGHLPAAVYLLMLPD